MKHRIHDYPARRMPVFFLLALVVHALVLFGGYHYTLAAERKDKEEQEQEEKKPKSEPVKFVFVNDEDRPPEEPVKKDKNFSDRDRRAAEENPDMSKPEADPTTQGRTFERAMATPPTPKPSPPPSPRPTPPRPQPKPTNTQPPMKKVEKEGGHLTDQKHTAEANKPQPQTPPSPQAVGSNISKELSTMAQQAFRPGFHNPNTRAVQRGSLSFDTSAFDFGPYARKVRQIVRSNWRPPSSAIFKGYCVIRFRIATDGKVYELELVESSGTPSYDEAALNAMRSSNPLPPLPEAFTEDSVGATFRFLYNMDAWEVPEE